MQENGIYGNGRFGVAFPFVTAMLKGDQGVPGHFTVKAGNAQEANSLQVAWRSDNALRSCMLHGESPAVAVAVS